MFHHLVHHTAHHEDRDLVGRVDFLRIKYKINGIITQRCFPNYTIKVFNNSIEAHCYVRSRISGSF